MMFISNVKWKMGWTVLETARIKRGNGGDGLKLIQFGLTPKSKSVSVHLFIFNPFFLFSHRSAHLFTFYIRCEYRRLSPSIPSDIRNQISNLALVAYHHTHHSSLHGSEGWEWRGIDWWEGGAIEMISIPLDWLNGAIMKPLRWSIDDGSLSKWHITINHRSVSISLPIEPVRRVYSGSHHTSPILINFLCGFSNIASPSSLLINLFIMVFPSLAHLLPLLSNSPTYSSYISIHLSCNIPMVLCSNPTLDTRIQHMGSNSTKSSSINFEFGENLLISLTKCPVFKHRWSPMTKPTM